MHGYVFRVASHSCHCYFQVFCAVKKTKMMKSKSLDHKLNLIGTTERGINDKGFCMM